MAFLFGGIVGSFLNVCILRIPEEGVSIFYPSRSHCPHCDYAIQWYDNIPVLSWVWLRGQCRSCKAPISLLYPLVELLSAIMAVAVVKRFGATLAALVIFVFICALIVVTFIDLAFWIIPDSISLPGIPLGVLAAWALGPPLPTWQDAALGALLGGGLFLTISLSYQIFLKRPGLGMGDVKLLAMLGAFLGYKALPGVILLASAQGLLVAVLLYVLGVRHSVEEIYEDDEDEALEKEAVGETKEASGEEAVKSAEAKAPKEGVSEVVEGKEGPSASKGTQGETVAEPVSPTTEEVGEEETEEDGEEVAFRMAAIQFGPFLCIAALEVLFFGKQIAAWYLSLFSIQ